ncbi:hypothetical protein GCM10009850_037330 [Nonomuraea monospora]|uniref:DUF1700 domain-containing protein n=1 Tax=Nonomuraea monospora TaxID=568818 RepID=A0ABP5P919_9ACTN
MAGHELISAQLNILAERLPARAVEELADGLHESYEHHLRRHGDPGAAARAAIAEFGDAEAVTAAFVRASPWRRMALTLLATGPVMAAIWATALVSGQAWAWPLPAPVKILYGLALLTAVGVLAASALATHAYRQTRGAVTGAALGLILLDLSMVISVLALSPGPVWPVAIAVPASLLRILAVGRMLPAALAT